MSTPHLAQGEALHDAPHEQDSAAEPGRQHSQLPTAEASHLPATRHSRKRPGFSPSELGLMLKLYREGKTQAQIAQRFAVTQSHISRILSEFEDNSDLASSYLKGNALQMARNIVRKGLARDHVQVLRGIRVLESEEKHAGITLTINGLVMPGMSLSPSPMHSVGASRSEGAQILEQIPTGSDNSSYANSKKSLVINELGETGAEPEA